MWRFATCSILPLLARVACRSLLHIGPPRRTHGLLFADSKNPNAVFDDLKKGHVFCLSESIL